MKSKKNICIVINGLAMGGAEKQSVLLAAALNPHHNVIMVILSPKGLYKPWLATLEKEKVSFKFLSTNIIKNLFQLSSLLKEYKADIVFSYLPTDTVFSGICGRIAGVPLIMGGIRNSFIPKWKFTVMRAVHNKWLNYSISNSYAGCKAAIDFGYSPNVFVIPNGIEIRKVDKTIKNTSQINIISLGRLVKQKRYDIAIQAVARLKKITKTTREIKYTIVGKGPEYDTILDLIKEYDVDKEIEVVTNAPDTYALLDAADIYLCSSSFEGISNSLLEAMNCALPIVATDVGDNSRLVKHERNGFLCAEDDFVDLSNRLNHLIEQPSTVVQMGLESHAHLKENFSFESFQKKYLRLIDNAHSISIKDCEFVA